MFTWVVKDAPNNGGHKLNRHQRQSEKYLRPDKKKYLQPGKKKYLRPDK